MREKVIVTTYPRITLKEYFEQALGPETLRKWHLLHTPGEGMWIRSGPWRVKQEGHGSARKFSRHVIFTQDLGDKAFLARIVGLDKIEVQDEQEMWASCSGDTWQVHTVSNPSTMLPVLGHMNSGWLFSDLEEVVDADGTPGVKVVCKVRAHVEKAPFGLRIPLELFLWSEMQRTVTILLSVINSRIQQYLKNRALDWDALSDWHDAMSTLSDIDHLVCKDLDYIGLSASDFDGTVLSCKCISTSPSASSESESPFSVDSSSPPRTEDERGFTPCYILETSPSGDVPLKRWGYFQRHPSSDLKAARKALTFASLKQRAKAVRSKAASVWRGARGAPFKQQSAGQRK